MIKRIAKELKEHIPFTALGALLGIVIMTIVILTEVPDHVLEPVFLTLHPLHVFLSAVVTAAMYARYRKGQIWKTIVIGWTGGVAIPTISDVLIPYLGGILLGVQIDFHVPFIEYWWINLLALAGIAIGYWRQTTKIPHFSHVLVSTLGSLFYMMAYGVTDWIPLAPFVFLILFVAVWLPCVGSDILYPLLFVREPLQSPSPKDEKWPAAEAEIHG